MRWQKEKDPLVPGRQLSQRDGIFLPLVGFFAVTLTVFAFCLWEGDAGVGDVSRAVSYFEEFFSENEAIAVFLGWEGK